MTSPALAAASERVSGTAWRMLGLGVAAQAASAMLNAAPAYLIPLLHLTRGLPLAQAGALAAAPSLGGVLTLVLWGAAADRFGERRVLVASLVLSGLFCVGAAVVPGYVGLAVLLALAGAAGAGTNGASGRVVVGWFPRSRRGMAMGIRQMAVPLGMALAALVVPPLGSGFGVWAPLLLVGVFSVVNGVACLVGIVSPPRVATAAATGERSVNPYRGSRFLARIHTLSALLVVPQFTLATFGLVWLITGLGWSSAVAGVVVALSQFVGAGGRIVVGWLSDRVGSRVRVLRWVAVSGVVLMLALAACGALRWDAASAVVLVAATAISVADNGLSFTSVAEAAGPSWSGRALGFQNTGQFLVSAAVGPGVGALVTAVGYPLGFALVALTPLAAIPLVPDRDAHSE